MPVFEQQSVDAVALPGPEAAAPPRQSAHKGDLSATASMPRPDSLVHFNGHGRLVSLRSAPM